MNTPAHENPGRRIAHPAVARRPACSSVRGSVHGSARGSAHPSSAPALLSPALGRTSSARPAAIAWLAAAVLLTVVLLVSPAPARAGANETPGESYQPKRFGAFSANLWEFGANEIPIFQRIVVGSQHYRQGAIYTDVDHDYSSGGGGIWNFFTFCTDRRHDVMFVTSHGFSDPTTLVEAYPWDARGRATRDSVLTYYNGIFGPGRVVARNIRGNFYGLAVTQAFYTAYFQTPQAFAWWSTCWSSLLSMTGTAEARVFLGYDDLAGVGKCICDENTVLNRMDGQEGQVKRPVGVAMAGINADCPPSAANPGRLILQGKGNTVLSPSVTQHAPTGIVCVQTPGFVRFDCTLDRSVNPASVVVGRGDGILVNHQWAGDDMVTFEVVPIRPCPTILYDVIESQARSFANRSRLDGNTRPAVNARGPNHDDYIWSTWCPCWPWIPFWVPDLIVVGDPSPGQPIELHTVLTNHSPEEMTVTGTLAFDGQPVQDLTFTIPPQETIPAVWAGTIRDDAVEGDVVHARVDFQAPGDPIWVEQMVPVSPRISAEILGPLQAVPRPAFFDVFCSLRHSGPVHLTQLRLVDTQGWAQPASEEALLAVGDGVILSLPYLVPEGTDPAMTSEFSLACEADGQPVTIPLGTVKLGAPVSIRRLSDTGMVPGSNDATIAIEIVSLSLSSLSPICVATSSDGWPCTVQCPPIPPLGTVTAQVMMPIPPDPSLIGHDGRVDLVLQDGHGYVSQESFGYVIQPALRVHTTPQSVYTGSEEPRTFAWTVELSNESDLPLNGLLQAPPAGLETVVPFSSFELAPGEHVTQSIDLRVLPDLGPGVYPIALQVQTNPPLGQQMHLIDHTVTEPVVVDLVARTYWSEGGETIPILAAVTNRRDDHAMSGPFQWMAGQPVLSGELAGFYELAPGQTDTLEVFCTPGVDPPRADSIEVTLTAGLTWDTGLPSSSTGSTTIYFSLPPDPSGVDEEPAPPLESGLSPVFPNPIRDGATVRYSLRRPGRVALTLHDAAGRQVAALAGGHAEAGEHAIHWRRASGEGSRAHSGIYFLRLVTPEGTATRKIVLID